MLNSQKIWLWGLNGTVICTSGVYVGTANNDGKFPVITMEGYGLGNYSSREVAETVTGRIFEQIRSALRGNAQMSFILPEEGSL